MQIKEVNKNNRNLVSEFINKNTLSDTFRYFNKRTIDVLDNHILTIVLINTDNNVNTVIGYGHIDYDEKYWLGICIVNEHIGKGYGKMIMNYLLSNNNVRNCKTIHLTVDKINEVAIKLYQKYNFKIIQEYNTYYLMNLMFDV